LKEVPGAARFTDLKGLVASSLPAWEPSNVPRPRRCADLSSAGPWPDRSTRIVTAAWRAAGSEIQMPAGPPLTLPEHCEITGVMQERTGVDGQRYAIRFHLRLPSDWNGRFFFEGGGGTEGELSAAVGIIRPGTPPAVARGYAVVSQDAGHDNATNKVAERGGTAAFGFDPQARANYGGASLRPVAEAAKAMLAAYYERPINRSYFVGCSKGGQEGMALAQRYPEVFDGIVANSPGFALPRAAVAEAWDTQAFGSVVAPPGAKTFDPALLPASFTDAHFALVRNAVLDACDADDGVRDGITSAFGLCTWAKVEAQLTQKACAGSPSDACLSQAQIAAIGRVYAGAKDSSGRLLYSDWPLDAGIGSQGWRIWKIGGATGGFPGINVAMGAPALASIFTTPPTPVHDDLASSLQFALRFDFDREVQKIYATDDTFKTSAWADISARSPQLESFRARGGRMIVAHGASDPVFSLNDTLAWYREVDQLNGGAASEFVRVFQVPGMAHCAGGPATDQFDAFGALVNWVEAGAAPDRLLATAGPQTPWPGRIRPLCAYPKVARYSGTGSIEDAANFRCE
jgi:feruloyl esterase